MDVRSLGYRTDLMVRRLAGSSINDEGHFIIVRTPENPGFHWGNFLLLPGPPSEAQFQEWMARFTEEFSDAAHMTFGIDGTTIPDDREHQAPAGMVADLSVVMTSERPPAGGEVMGTPTVRPLRSDGDWDQEHLLRLVQDEGDQPHSPDHLDFLRRSTDEARRMVAGGHAEYFGAFTGDRLCSVVGIASDGQGVARYQNVGTHPGFRRRGLASTLLARAGLFGTEEMGARQLVIVAEHDSKAAALYRAVGFVPVEMEWGLSASPGPHPIGH
jgi:ribosomal protein S18 acetylase RimI-like enzyme